MKIFDREYRQPKHYVAGTHRARDPEATLAAYLPLCERLGITRLADITGLDCVGVPVYQCVRPGSRTLSLSQGKGLTPAAAKASALMESIEGWHAETMAVSTRVETPRLMKERATTIDLSSLPRRSPRPIDPDRPMTWVLGYDLVAQERIWVPYEVVDLNRIHGVRYDQIFQNSSKGLASGNHLLEAITHGLCEVIEHDAHVLWHYDASDPLGTRTLVAQDTVDDPACCEVLARFAAASITIAITELTCDTGVPCYQALALDDRTSLRALGYAWGQGCHPDPSIALLRALTEAAQTRLTYIAGARDDLSYEDYAARGNDDQAVALRELLARSQAPRDFRAQPAMSTTTFEDDIQVLMTAARRAGSARVVVVDLTHEAHQVPVVKVLVPGMEGPLTEPARYLPGRRALHAAARVVA